MQYLIALSISFPCLHWKNYSYRILRGSRWIIGIGLGLLGNSSTASGSSDPSGRLPRATIGLWDFFMLCRFHVFPYSLFISCLRCVCLLSHFLFPCVFGTTLVHEFHIFYSHNQWNLIFIVLWKQGKHNSLFLLVLSKRWVLIDARCHRIRGSGGTLLSCLSMEYIFSDAYFT